MCVQVCVCVCVCKCVCVCVCASVCVYERERERDTESLKYLAASFPALPAGSDKRNSIVSLGTKLAICVLGVNTGI